MTYNEKLKDSRWLKKREALFRQRGEICQSCGTVDHLTVHHGYYRPKGNPWDYEDESLWVLCWPCHEHAQTTLTEIHRIIGHIHPDEYDAVRDRVGDSTFDIRHGITQEEVAQLMKEEKEASLLLYSDYSVSIISSTELGATRAYDLEDALNRRFPGIDTGVSTAGGERDAIASVSGPDKDVSNKIQAWCDKWHS